jgi:tRNA G18 (ribose-2'-O)-methylase SpoU
MSSVFLILHNIRSAHNVGSIFRTADAAAVSRIYLTGCTPAPVDRFGRTRKDFVKVSLGAEKAISWKQVARIGPLLNALKKDGVHRIAVEQDPTSTDYRRARRAKRAAFVFGNEVAGLPRRVLSQCDQIVEIPMRGTKESLNVAVAAGIVLFQHRCDRDKS